MHQIVYIAGAAVIVVAVLSFVGVSRPRATARGAFP